jgi:hypothetical protein
MHGLSSVTEAIVRNHLQAFLQRKGVAAILEDYDPDARFYTESRIYEGTEEIRGFFEDFMQSLPPGAIERFALRSLRVGGRVAHITWNVGTDIPLGTDTFVVERGKIISQTFAMHLPQRA